MTIETLFLPQRLVDTWEEETKRPSGLSSTLLSAPVQTWRVKQCYHILLIFFFRGELLVKLQASIDCKQLTYKNVTSLHFDLIASMFDQNKMVSLLLFFLTSQFKSLYGNACKCIVTSLDYVKSIYKQIREKTCNTIKQMTKTSIQKVDSKLPLYV